MAFDEKLAARIRSRLDKVTGVVENKMFGGIAFLLKGNMCCGVHRDALIVRLDPSDTDRALSEPHARVFDHERVDPCGPEGPHNRSTAGEMGGSGSQVRGLASAKITNVR
jgi:hypothetical protein